jgi:DNA-binding LacI/PurR family transcriptional regulator
MEKRVTAKDVAKLAGVSVSAVSRTFTEGASASLRTRDKVQAAARHLGYQPNLLARGLMTGRTELVGLVSNNFDNPAYMEIFNLFTLGLQHYGFKPLLINFSGKEDSAKALTTLRQYDVDAIIVASSTMPKDFIEGYVGLNIPVIQAFGHSGQKGQLESVAADNRAGGQLAADVLAERGYRRIAFLGGPRHASSTRDRLSGFRAGLKAKGIPLVEERFGNAYSHAVGQELMRDLLAQPVIDAVFCGDDVIAIGALDACREAGIDVPNALGLIGFNDIAMASWPAYRLTTIRQPIGEIILAAVERAIHLIAEPNAQKQNRIFPCEIVIRQTLR